VADKIVDASALAAATFLETEAATIEARLSGHKLFAPHLLPYEMSNICWRKMRQNPDKRAAIFEQLIYSRSLPIQLRDVDFPQVVELANRHGLTAYDASYLWLARNMNVELVTLDKDLKEAADVI
jgi:predicted nucleic acid-binding protein